MDKNIDEVIKTHWKDPDFDKIRDLFLDYIIVNGIDISSGENDEYISAIAYLLGIDYYHSEDGWDTMHEKRNNDFIEYIIEYMKRHKL